MMLDAQGRPIVGVDYRLFRFVDTNVEAGKTYRYRVRLSLWNPNRDLEGRYLTDAALANDVKLTVSGDSARPVIEVELTDAWVWDMYRKSRFVPKVRVLTFKDVNVEELPVPDLSI